MKNYDCTTCTRPDCVHRDCYRRLPLNVGGLDLCPGHIDAAPTSVKPAVDTAALEAKIAEMQELDRLAQEAKEAADTIKDEIKAIMTEQGTDELVTGKFIIKWTTVLSNRFDSTAFKKAAPDLYKTYTKQITSRRFTVS